MTLANDFNIYKEEIELIQAQNPVECELYSIIACIIRERKGSTNISLRDVSTRKTSDLSKPFKSDAGFPDFVILPREQKSKVSLGAIEAKSILWSLDKGKNKEQLVEHIKKFKKIIYTNGFEWRLYDGYEEEPEWTVKLGESSKGEIRWSDVNQWKNLLKKLDEIKWVK